MRAACSTLIVHDALGESLAHFPLYIVEALCVEARRARRRPRGARSPSASPPARCIGTVGLAAEWGWSHVWMPLPWSVEILPETIVLGLAMALAASTARRLDRRAPRRRTTCPYSETGTCAGPPSARPSRSSRCSRFPLNTQADSDVRAKVALTNVAGRRRAHRPRDGHADPARRRRRGQLADDHRPGRAAGSSSPTASSASPQGVYRSTQPVPVHGEWKTMVRLHKGNSIIGLPIYAPEDTAIPAPARRRACALRARLLLRPRAAAARGQDAERPDHVRRLRHGARRSRSCCWRCSPGACTASA